ncbi:hypothetical protein LCGC14_2680640, partial [marine sediment metagenome]
MTKKTSKKKTKRRGGGKSDFASFRVVKNETIVDMMRPGDLDLLDDDGFEDNTRYDSWTAMANWLNAKKVRREDQEGIWTPSSLSTFCASRNILGPDEHFNDAPPRKLQKKKMRKTIKAPAKKPHRTFASFKVVEDKAIVSMIWPDSSNFFEDVEAPFDNWGDLAYWLNTKKVRHKKQQGPWTPSSASKFLRPRGIIIDEKSDLFFGVDEEKLYDAMDKIHSVITPAKEMQPHEICDVVNAIMWEHAAQNLNARNIVPADVAEELRGLEIGFNTKYLADAVRNLVGVDVT